MAQAAGSRSDHSSWQQGGDHNTIALPREEASGSSSSRDGAVDAAEAAARLAKTYVDWDGDIELRQELKNGLAHYIHESCIATPKAAGKEGK